MTTEETPDLEPETSEELENQHDDNVDADELEVETEVETDPLDEANAKIAELEDQLARARAETYNVSQEYAAYVRRSKADQADAKTSGSKSVIDNLLSVLDDIELARQHDDLQGPGATISAKLENVLKANYGLERYGAEGDEFDPNIHEALMHSTGDVQTEQVQALIQPGYKMGDKVIRPARVGVVSPQ